MSKDLENFRALMKELAKVSHLYPDGDVCKSWPEDIDALSDEEVAGFQAELVQQMAENWDRFEEAEAYFADMTGKTVDDATLEIAATAKDEQVAQKLLDDRAFPILKTTQ